MKFLTLSLCVARRAPLRQFATKLPMDKADRLRHIVPNNTDIYMLDCTEAFGSLTDREQKYIHYLSQAAFHGGLACLFQVSAASPPIYLLLQKLFRAQTTKELEKLAIDKLGFSDDEFQAFVMYAAGFYTNMGNYKSFGGTKFIPDLPKKKFADMVMKSAAAAAEPGEMKSLLESVLDVMYSLEEHKKELAFPPKGTTTYFSKNCTIADAHLAQEFLVAMNISPYNTRLVKIVDPDTGKVVYEVWLASSRTDDEEDIPGLENILGYHDFESSNGTKSVRFRVRRGDHSKLMACVVENLKQAKKYTSNEKEDAMIEEYIQSFETGSLPAHINACRHWIHNKSPTVETYMAFLESYRDPYGTRGEWEAIVGVKDDITTAKFAKLVEASKELIPLLPWGDDFEKDRFLAPDFSSLHVLSYAGSNVYGAINIPNYDALRQNEGFKNLYFENTYPLTRSRAKTLVSKRDKAFYMKWARAANIIRVGLHELLGHGTGKFFIRDENGEFNFDIENTIHPVTKEKITSWYESAETYESRFSVLAAAYEECRANSVSLYLSFSPIVHGVFGYKGQDADDIVYALWLSVARYGMVNLQHYSPQSGLWGQVHAPGLFAILRVLIEAGEDFVTLEETEGDDGEPDILLTMDRNKIVSVGKPAIGNFLRKLQVYRSTGDYAAGKRLFEKYTTFTEEEKPHFMRLRQTVLMRRLPRKMFVQHHTYIEDDQVRLKSFEDTAAGVVESFGARFASHDIDDIIEELWEQQKHHF